MLLQPHADHIYPKGLLVNRRGICSPLPHLHCHCFIRLQSPIGNPLTYDFKGGRLPCLGAERLYENSAEMTVKHMSNEYEFELRVLMRKKKKENKVPVLPHRRAI